jgi:choice-of-anchor B domain-containing protein
MRTYLLLLFVVLYGVGSSQTEATLLGRWSDPNLVGSSAYNNTYNEIWGLAIGDREYAVIGSTAGTHFVDVTDPAQAEEVYFVHGASAGPHIIHRDYHNYRCYLYGVADEGTSSLQIMDVSYLPDSVSVVYDTNISLMRSHNIFIDTAEAKLYCLAAFGGPASGSAMRIYDISSPTEPVYLAEYNNFGGLAVGHVHDAHINNGLAYLNCGNNGFAIVDFTDPLAPQTLGLLTSYVFSGYNHSGWPSADGQHYYLGDENHGYPIKVLDVSDPADVEVLGVVPAPKEAISQTIPHNQIVACNYLYVSYYYDGLRIYDISDPANPVPHSYYPTSVWPFDNNYRGAWGVYPYLPSGNVLVSDMQRGLFVLSGPGDTCGDRDLSHIDCAVATPTSELEASVPTLRVYPQPAQGQLHLQTTGDFAIADATLQLFLLNGQLVYTFPRRDIAAAPTALDLPALPAGVYLLRVTTATAAHAVKVVVE